ncbi:Protein of unknown function [Actinopolyspora alba]|uniref:DUF2530 domain-containing protein n=1 Tax=Actinopolyspora alba TaxID=673379 RepID=A0A1I1Y1S6_9ACTN|nr:DUF2530 domain-containing protein [Actinopolyspora alba]SFE13617.1 Protein of unknown function [Actinopolyspora alba]
MAADDNDAPTGPPQMRPVPPLPAKLAGPTPVVVTGTLCWLVAAVVFGMLGWTSSGVDVRFWTCVTGGALGVLGYCVFRWQRSASRRGSRGSWQGLAGLDG